MDFSISEESICFLFQRNMTGGTDLHLRSLFAVNMEFAYSMKNDIM